MANSMANRMFSGCAKITDFEITGRLGEGTFGVVSKGRSKRTGAVVALKKILMHNERDGFPITALREIKLLKMLSHPNVLKLTDMAVEHQKGDGKKRAIMYMITPYMDHDLSGMTTNPDIHFTLPQIKCYLLQLLEGLRYLHASNILHRDMKAANILISNTGVLQIADFGLARHYDGETPQPGRGNGMATRDYTTLVVTRWYRPPELLLQFRAYTPAIDMWGAGCVFAEMFECKPILEGKTDLNQAEIIFDLLGSPTEQSMPGWRELPGCEGVRDWGSRRANIDSRFKRLGPEGLDLFKQMMRLDWRTRINAQDAMNHPYFTTPPLPARAQDLPKFEESHELDRRKHQEKRSARPPPAPAGGAVGMGPNDAWSQPGLMNGNSSRPPVASADRDRRYPPQMRDRPPAGMPPRPDARGPPPSYRERDGFNGRVPPPPPRRDGPPSHDARRLPGQETSGSFPPRPPPVDPPRPSQSNVNSNRGDTYVPNRDGAPAWQGSGRRDRDIDAPSTNGYNGDGSARNSDRGYSSNRPSESPIERPPINGGHEREQDRGRDPNRDRDRDRRDNDLYRPARSRSPTARADVRDRVDRGYERGGERDRQRGDNRDRERERDQERTVDREVEQKREPERRERDKDAGRPDRENDTERRDRDRDRDRDREREHERERDKRRLSDRDRDRDSGHDRERDRDRDRDRGRERDAYRR